MVCNGTASILFGKAETYEAVLQHYPKLDGNNEGVMKLMSGITCAFVMEAVSVDIFLGFLALHIF